MKTTLPFKSKDHHDRIKKIVDIILNIEKNQIAFIILFGSFARGSWVHHTYMENGIIYEYASDYDILIITKTKKLAKPESAYDLEDKIRLEFNNQRLTKKHNVTLIIESLEKVNSELEKDRYFFSDIKEEGVLLYSAEGCELSESKEWSEKERRNIAREDYKYWFNSGLSFFDTAFNRIKKNDCVKAAFQLHQATECFYHCTLLVLTGYKYKSHDLEKLNRLCLNYSNKFLAIFPETKKEQRNCFKLLKVAYIEARYNKEYKINKTQLKYLFERVEKLKDVTEEVCKSKI